VATGDMVGRLRLCRYAARPILSMERLSLTKDGRIALALRHPYADGTTHIVFAPLELIARLCALIPVPRSHLIHFHGVLAPSAAWRSDIIPKAVAAAAEEPAPLKLLPPKAKNPWIPWAELLRKTFLVDALVCPKCRGKMRVRCVVRSPDTIHLLLPVLGHPAQAPVLRHARAGPC
jgi:hypothetical protein